MILLLKKTPSAATEHIDADNKKFGNRHSENGDLPVSLFDQLLRWSFLLKINGARLVHQGIKGL